MPENITGLDSIMAEADVQGVLLMVYHALARNSLYRSGIEKWKNPAHRLAANNIRIFQYHELLHEWMTKARIPYVILKGAASAEYYPDPYLREMGDVDFLVEDKQLATVGRILETQGFTRLNEKNPQHIVYLNPIVFFEMHFQLPGMPDGSPGRMIDSYLEDIYTQSRPYGKGETDMIVPSPFHHGLILLLHTSHHLTGEGIGLRHLCDWAVFENSLGEEEFTAIFEKKLKDVGLWEFAKILTMLSCFYLGAPPRKWASVSEPGILLQSLIQDMLASGNFGIKDAERSNQTYIISSRGKNGVGNTNILQQFFSSINRIVTLKWPASHKYRLLLPIGWLYFGLGYLVNILKGKRQKIHPGKMLAGAIHRRKIYAQLRLFQAEAPDNEQRPDLAVKRACRKEPRS